MNLHSIVSSAIGAVNPFVLMEVRVATGYATAADGERTPTYEPTIARSGQVQPLTSGDIRHLDSLNIQGATDAIYFNGTVSGLVRRENKGGDLITHPDGRVFLVTTVLEQWPDWVKVAVTLQNN